MSDAAPKVTSRLSISDKVLGVALAVLLGGGAGWSHKLFEGGAESDRRGLAERVHVLEDKQQARDIAAAARDAHIDEQLSAIHGTLVDLVADMKILTEPRRPR